MHDYGHKGLTNDYLVNTKDTLAMRYNDISPNENFHASGAFCLMMLPQNSFLGHLPRVSG
jgi:hypothetical protein